MHKIKAVLIVLQFSNGIQIESIVDIFYPTDVGEIADDCGLKIVNQIGAPFHVGICGIAQRF